MQNENISITVQECILLIADKSLYIKLYFTQIIINHVPVAFSVEAMPSIVKEALVVKIYKYFSRWIDIE